MRKMKYVLLHLLYEISTLHLQYDISTACTV